MQANGIASLQSSYITPQAVQNALLGFKEDEPTGRHLLQSATVKVPALGFVVMTFTCVLSALLKECSWLSPSTFGQAAS